MEAHQPDQPIGAPPPRPVSRPPRLLRRVWGDALAVLDRTRRFDWADLLVLAGLAGVVWAAIGVSREWRGVLRPEVVIDLSPRRLPEYALFSLARGLLAYGLSLAFTLTYGYWAAKDRLAQRVLIPLLDVLQSVPVLGFMPGLVLSLVAAFPRSNIGLELAAVVMIFTGQVWNMTFSYYHSLRAVPLELREVAAVYRFNGWERLRWVELPYAAVGLVWNSMMSMAGGWFFLMISEAFVLGDRDFRLPGLGSYMSVAVARGDTHAMLGAIAAMIVLIVFLDQILWRPLVAWSQKFRSEEVGSADAAQSWLLDWLRVSRLVAWARRRMRRAGALPPALSSAAQDRVEPAPGPPHQGNAPSHGSAGAARPAEALSGSAPARGPRSGPTGPAAARVVSRLVFVLLVAGLLAGAAQLVRLLHGLPPGRWIALVWAALWTLVRVLAATALGTLWALQAGLAIGLSPRLSRVLQPVIQIAASFPAPMLFPAAIAVLHAAGVSLGWGSIALMLLGTQWYILFNVVAGATAIPADLREAARGYRFGPLERMRRVYIPAVFPYLVTGWVTAAGGAWNASIVAEYVSSHGQVLVARGVGSAISVAAERGDLRSLAAGVLVLSTLVVVFNRTLWRRLYRLAEDRYALNR